MPAVAASHNSINVGDIKITYLPDGEAFFACSVFPDTPDECWARHIEQTADGRWVCSIGGFLVESGDSKVLVDLGFGQVELEVPDFATASSGRFMDSLARTGVAPGDVDAVVYTHMHSDHTGWTATGEQLTFGNARHVSGQGEVAYWSANAEADFAPAAQLAFADRIEESSDGETIAPGVQVMHTPGHTPGHQVVVVSSGADRAMILGDLVHCAAQLSEPDMRFMFDVDPSRARQWRDQILEQLSDSGTSVGASHFSGSAFGRVVTGEGRRYWSFL